MPPRAQLQPRGPRLHDRALHGRRRARRDGVDPQELAPIIEAIGAGDMAKGIELTTPDLAERLSVAGTPEECVEKMQNEIAAAASTT